MRTDLFQVAIHVLFLLLHLHFQSSLLPPFLPSPGILYHGDIMASSKSTDSFLSPSAQIEYKRLTALLLLTLLTLYPTPSPLFYIICLPALILLHRHDSRLFVVYTAVCVGLVKLVADLREGREIIHTVVHSLMVVGGLLGSITGHHRLLLEKRNAWFESLLYGILFTGCGLVCRTTSQVS
jgi:hypothetical protein